LSFEALKLETPSGEPSYSIIGREPALTMRKVPRFFMEAAISFTAFSMLSSYFADE